MTSPHTLLILTSVLILATSSPSLAYVDPGLAGILFQVGYVIFYGVIGALAFLTRPFSFLRRKKKDQEDDDEEADVSEDSDDSDDSENAEEEEASESEDLSAEESKDGAEAPQA